MAKALDVAVRKRLRAPLRAPLLVVAETRATRARRTRVRGPAAATKV